MATTVDSIGANYYAQQYPQVTSGYQQQVETPPLQYQQGLTSDQVSFSGKGGEEKKNSHKALKIAFGVAITAVGAYFLHKNWGTVSKWVKGLFGKGTEKVAETANKANKTLQAAKNKVPVAPKHPKIKHTSVTGAAKTATNAAEAKIVQSINVQHANASSRKLVEQAARDVVTPQAQKAYDAAIAYVAPNQAQKRALAELASSNKAQRAAVNTVQHVAKGGEKLEQVAQQVATQATKQAKTAKSLVAGIPYKLATGNAYVVDNTGNIVKVILKDGHELVDPLKVAKHLAKFDINPGNLVKTLKQAA